MSSIDHLKASHPHPGPGINLVTWKLSTRADYNVTLLQPTIMKDLTDYNIVNGHNCALNTRIRGTDGSQRTGVVCRRLRFPPYLVVKVVVSILLLERYRHEVS